MHIKEVYKRTPRRRRTRMIETVCVIERKYQKRCDTRRKMIIESRDEMMKDWKRLKGVCRMSYQKRSQSQWLKWHGKLTWVCKGA